MKICLDPGHYGSDFNPGVAAGYVESNFTWDYYLLLKAELEKYGVEVIGTRASKNDYPKKANGGDNLKARGKMSEGCDLLVSIHSNAATEEPIEPKNWVTAWWSIQSGGEGVTKAIVNALSYFLGNEWGYIMPPESGVWESENSPGKDYLGVLRGCSSVGTPGCVIEHSFHTNVQYCEWAMTSGNIARMAEVEAKAIADYYGLKRVETPSAYFIPLNVDLKKGDKGEEVKNMQMRFRQINAEFDAEVAEHSFKNGEPDGSFGGKMVNTVKKLQSLTGLPETGELDYATRILLNTSVVDYSNRITDLIQSKSEMAEELNNELIKANEVIAQQSEKIDSAVKILAE